MLSTSSSSLLAISLICLDAFDPSPLTSLMIPVVRLYRSQAIVTPATPTVTRPKQLRHVVTEVLPEY